MAKAVMKAMQAVQEYTTQENIAELDGWLVSGASKRGWTTWMVGAASAKCTWCPKVDALAPIVPIVPNLREGVHHMWQAYGGFSFAFNDYTDVNLTVLIDSDEVKELFKIVDPINYLSRLNKIPKFVVDSSDDEFMMMEWTNNWFDAFNENGEMNLWIGANVEHSMATGVIGLMKTLGNYANSVFLGGTRPKMSHTLDKTNGQITVQIPADQAHGKVGRLGLQEPPRQVRKSVFPDRKVNLWYHFQLQGMHLQNDPHRRHPLDQGGYRALRHHACGQPGWCHS